MLPLQQGENERGVWKSQEIVVEAEQCVEYPDRYLLHLSGNAVNQLAGISEGMTVEALWSASVREWTTKDGRTALRQELRCWRIAPASGNTGERETVGTLPC